MMGNDKAEGQRQAAVSDLVANRGSRPVVASKRSGGPWWFVICLIGFALLAAIGTRFLPSDRPSLAVPDYIHIVTTDAARKARPSIYNYKVSSQPTPSTANGVALGSDIDDRSSEAAYQRSCLAALTRDKNPEIMALSEAVREDMCTDPRRK